VSNDTVPAVREGWRWLDDVDDGPPLESAACFSQAASKSAGCAVAAGIASSTRAKAWPPPTQEFLYFTCGGDLYFAGSVGADSRPEAWRRSHGSPRVSFSFADFSSVNSRRGAPARS